MSITALKVPLLVLNSFNEVFNAKSDHDEDRGSTLSELCLLVHKMETTKTTKQREKY